MSKEEKATPYLQDLFNHMYDEHGLILTHSEMLEILCICGKEYDTVQLELCEIERQNKDLSSQLAAYKEALRELYEASDNYIYYENIPCQEERDSLDVLEKAIAKAKTLIEEV